MISVPLLKDMQSLTVMRNAGWGMPTLSEAHPETMDLLSRAWCDFAVKEAYRREFQSQALVLHEYSINSFDDGSRSPNLLKLESINMDDTTKPLPPWKTNDVKGGYRMGAIERYDDDLTNHPPRDTQLWHDVTGGTKKGRSFGFGNHLDPNAILSGPSSTTGASSSFQQHIVDNLMSQVQELRAREAERQVEDEIRQEEDEIRREEDARREEARRLERAQYEEMCELIKSLSQSTPRPRPPPPS